MVLWSDNYCLMNKLFVLIIALFIANSSLASTQMDSTIHVAQNEKADYEVRLDAYKKVINHYLKPSLETALLYSEEYLELAKQNTDDKNISMGLFYKAKVYSKHNELETAEELYSESYNLAKTLKDPDLTTYVMLNLGILKSNLGDHSSALEILNDCKTIATESQNYEYVLKALNSIGNIYLALGDYSKAQVAFLEALNVNKILKNNYYDAVLSVGVGNTYLVLSAFEDAITYYYEAIKFAEKEENTFIKMIALTNVNSSLIALKQYDEAVENIKKSIQYFTDNNEKQFVAQAMQMLTKAYSEQGNHELALQESINAKTIFEEVKSNENIMFSLNDIGSQYIHLGETQKAEEALLEAQRIGEKYQYYSNLGSTYALLGQLYLESHKSLGISYYKKAQELSEIHSLNEARISVYHKLYLFNKKEGNYKLALDYYENYKQLNDSLKGEDSKLNVEEIETRYEVDKKDQEITLLQKEQEIAAITLAKEQEESRSQRILILLASGIIILIIGIVVLRLKARQKSKIQALETRGLKVETKMLRSQMNPHFIFNSLNSIQSFISDKDTLDAERYMSKFAKLMRLILDNSRKSFILVENEITTLNHYLELEQLRFDKRFTFSVSISNIDDEFTLIPPMLVQPYVENAILHGIGGLLSGHISIVYKQKGEKVICTIDDNGVGRKKSGELKAKNQTTRESLGIKVTEERIALLKAEFKTSLTIQIIDKYDDHEKSLGTRVIIEMPFTEK